MTEQRKRIQELNMLITKREDYLRYLSSEVRKTNDELSTLKTEYNLLNRGVQ